MKSLLILGSVFLFVGAAAVGFALLCSDNKPQDQTTPTNANQQADPGEPKNSENNAKGGTGNYKDQNRNVTGIRGWLSLNKEWIDPLGVLLVAAFTLLLFLGTLALYDATRNLVNDAKDTAERQLRAYVFVTPTNININGNTLAIRYAFQNTGQTPAYKVKHASKLEILPYPLPKDFVISSPSSFVGGNSLGKGVPLNGEANISFTGNPATLKESGKRIYLVVLITYFDAFKNERTTRMCVSVANFDAMVQAIIEATKGGKISGSFPDIEFEYPDQHNDSD